MQNKLCALSFDDGPNTTITVQMLDVLKTFAVPASFFLIGNLITDKTLPIIKRAVEQGCDIENHSFTHSDMKSMEKATIRDEFEKTSDLIEKHAGSRPIFFRPPYISVSDTMYEAIDVPFICGLGVEDWVATVSADERARRILSQISDGTILLLHDADWNAPTVEAVKQVVPVLKEQGYEFVTVPELFRRSGADKTRKGKIWSNVYGN